MALNLETIQEAHKRISPYIAETPLIRLQRLDDVLGCQVYVKAECMQLTGAFKLRGAMNKLLSMTEEQRAAGVVASSSGNHGRATAYAAKLCGCKATVVVPRTAAPVKIQAIRDLGAEIILCQAEERHELAAKICRERGASLAHPFNDETIMAGQGTAGLEIMKQCPDADAVVSPLSGGGLLGGIATAVKAICPDVKVYGAEPGVLPRYTESLKAGKPVTVPFRSTVADALITQTPGDVTFPVIRDKVDGVAAVDEAYIRKATVLMLTEGKIYAEPAAFIGIAAVLQGLLKFSRDDKVVFVLSGGNIGFEQMKTVLEEA